MTVRSFDRILDPGVNAPRPNVARLHATPGSISRPQTAATSRTVDFERRVARATLDTGVRAIQHRYPDAFASCPRLVMDIAYVKLSGTFSDHSCDQENMHASGVEAGAPY